MKATQKLKILFALVWGTILPVLSPQSAEANNELTVYIECKHPKKLELAVFKGTGVVISSVGHVLTAEHVMPEGYECEGSIENNTLAKRQLQVDFKDFQLSDKIDGKLLRFIASSGEEFEYATYCAANAANVGDVIVVKGFHGKSKGLPSATLGILSTYIPNQRGILETDANTVGGKSGGPVFLQNTNTIIGIVAGAEFDPSGLPAYYGVLTAEALTQFGVLQKSESCDGSDAVADLAKPTTEQAPEAISPMLAEKAMELSWADRKLVQESLTAIGFDTGGADGVWGNNTRKAISGWQSSLGAEPIGYLSQEQKDRLITSAASRVVQAKNTASTSIKPAAAAPTEGESALELFVRARKLVDNDDEREALPLLDRAIELDPQNANFLAWRGFAYYEVGQPNKALVDLNMSLKLDPSDGTAWVDRGWANMKLGNANEAFSDFQKAVELSPGATDAPEGLKELCKDYGKC